MDHAEFTRVNLQTPVGDQYLQLGNGVLALQKTKRNTRNKKLYS